MLCSTPTGRTRSSTTATSPTRLTPLASRCVTGPRGGSVRTPDRPAPSADQGGAGTGVRDRPSTDDLVNRGFTADASNELWLTDITEHPTGESKLYLCAINDVYSGRGVGYSMDSHMKSHPAVHAINSAVARRGDITGCVLHSDRGSRFRSTKMQAVLAHYGLVGSMGRVGACGDNAAMESFFSLLQNKVLDRQSWATRDELRPAIVYWIERIYHRRRCQDRLSCLTSIEYETILTHTATQAA